MHVSITLTADETTLVTAADRDREHMLAANAANPYVHTDYQRARDTARDVLSDALGYSLADKVFELSNDTGESFATVLAHMADQLLV